MKTMRIFPLFLVLLLCLPVHADMDVEHAEAAALAWIEAIDRGDILEAWHLSSPLMQEIASPDALAKAIQAARGGMGSVIDRKLVDARRETSLPGAPDGEYIVLSFHARFENKQQAVETVTPRRENGTWKVSGYFIR